VGRPPVSARGLARIHSLHVQPGGEVRLRGSGIPRVRQGAVGPLALVVGIRYTRVCQRSCCRRIRSIHLARQPGPRTRGRVMCIPFEERIARCRAAPLRGSEAGGSVTWRRLQRLLRPLGSSPHMDWPSMRGRTTGERMAALCEIHAARPRGLLAVIAPATDGTAPGGDGVGILQRRCDRGRTSRRPA
jgi:hypothetical protein